MIQEAVLVVVPQAHPIDRYVLLPSSTPAGPVTSVKVQSPLFRNSLLGP